MTLHEKKIVLAALSAYAKQQERKAKNEMRKGEFRKCAEARAEAGEAQTLMFVFGELLTVKCGEAKI